jgi:hypothetical protein
VETPFVRVYRDPFGGKHVQTPYVDVYRPGRGLPPGAISLPPWVAPPVQVGSPALPQPSIARRVTSPREQLLEAVVEFDRSLSRFETAATWQQYFALDDGGALSPRRLADPQTQPTPDLAAMVDRFETIERDNRYPMIAGLPSFGQTRARLVDYLNSASQAASNPLEELPAPAPESRLVPSANRTGR